MNKYISFIMFVPIIAFAELVVTYDSRFMNMPDSNIRVVDVSSSENPDVKDFISLGINLRRYPAPSLVDTSNKITIPITGSVHQARQSLKALRVEVEEQDEEHKEARREWRQVRRDIAQAIGLPATNGLSWNYTNSYAMVLNVTNVNNRQDFNLRLIEADLNLTRHQIQREWPNVDWWFDRSSEDE